MSGKDLASILNEFQEKILDSINTDNNNNSNNFNFDDLYSSLDTINDNIVGLKETLKVKKPEVNSNIVKINVGGTLFATLKSTLSKKHESEIKAENLFEQYLSGKQIASYDENKAIFFDRNPQHFITIIEYLRKLNTKSSISLQNYTNEELIELLQEAEFYKLDGLKRLIWFECLPSNILGLTLIDSFFSVANLLEKRRRLLYRASRDGFSSQVFHSKCDDKANTITIIKTENSFIFGGYANARWNSDHRVMFGYAFDYKYKADQHAFVFTISNNLGKLVKYNCHNNEEAILALSDYGPSFKHYFQISNNSNANKESYSAFGRGVHGYTNEADVRGKDDTLLFTESFNFKVSEIEVFTSDF